MGWDGFFFLWFGLQSEIVLVHWTEGWFHSYTNKNKSGAMKVQTLYSMHTHTHTPSVSLQVVVSWSESETRRPLESGCVDLAFKPQHACHFWAWKPPHSGSYESDHAEQCPSVTLFPFAAFFQSWHQLLLLEKKQLLLSLRASLVAKRAAKHHGDERQMFESL